MRCSKCNEYVPEGLGIKECPLCGGEVQEKSVKPIEEKITLESKRILEKKEENGQRELLLKINITKIIIFVIGFIVNLIIAIYCIQSIRYCSEFATALINLGNKIAIIFIGIVFTSLFCLAVHFIHKYLSKYIILAVFISLILVGAMGIAYYNTCMSIINPKPLTEKQLIKNAIKREEEDKREATKLLKEAELFVPDKKIMASDKNILEQSIKNLLLSFSEQSEFSAEMNDSVRLFHINNLLSRHYRNADTADFRIISDSLQCDFVLYSPDYQHFISVLTYYQHYPNTINHYNGMVLLCERKENAIDVYSYTNPLNQYGWYSREDFLHRAIFHMKSSMGYHNGLDSRYTFKTDEFLEYPHPLKRDFWQDKYFFSVISIQGENYLRYQTYIGYNFSKPEYVVRPMYKIRLD